MNYSILRQRNTLIKCKKGNITLTRFSCVLLQRQLTPWLTYCFPRPTADPASLRKLTGWISKPIGKWLQPLKSKLQILWFSSKILTLLLTGCMSLQTAGCCCCSQIGIWHNTSCYMNNRLVILCIFPTLNCYHVRNQQYVDPSCIQSFIYLLHLYHRASLLPKNY